MRGLPCAGPRHRKPYPPLHRGFTRMLGYLRGGFGERVQRLPLRARTTCAWTPTAPSTRGLLLRRPSSRSLFILPVFIFNSNSASLPKALFHPPTRSIVGQARQVGPRVARATCVSWRDHGSPRSRREGPCTTRGAHARVGLVGVGGVGTPSRDCPTMLRESTFRSVR